MQIRLIDLPLNLPGYYNFISSWLITIDNKNILVDPGPTASIPILIESLNKYGIKKLAAVLLTHIHLDHAGGIGDLVNNFNVEKVFCFSKATKHLLNPEQLWEASKANLKEFALVQGEPKAVAKNIVFEARERIVLDNLEIPVFETPGHASHHISYLIKDHLFIGEALGVIVEGNSKYLRPATPPKFSKEVYLSSIAKLSTVDAKYLCFGHFGKRENSRELFDNSLKQIKAWIETVSLFIKEDNYIEDVIIDTLIKEDQFFSEFINLSSEIKLRELRFIKNSIKGIKDYLINPK